MRLKGKVAVITGAAQGIGEAAALLFAKEGARIVIVDNNAEKGQETVDMIVKNKGDAIFVKADVSKTDDVKKIFEVTKEKYGSLHILYNNAAIFLRGIDGPITEISEKDWDKILDVNLKGVFLCCKYGIPEIIRSGGGVIINTSSSAGVIGIPKCDAYTATKGAVVSLTRSLAVEYGPKKIRVNCIAPAAIYTEMVKESNINDPEFDEQKFLKTTPVRRWGTPIDIASIALFLASEEASYLNGAIIVADGGITIT